MSAVQFSMRVIAHIENDFDDKFGIPRQSGIADMLSAIVFEPEYRSTEAFRGLEGYSHIWIIWQFSKALREGWSPTVRPPVLGGNKRMGVFATRSPYRPNPIGLSSAELLRVELNTDRGPVLYVRGADMQNGTPVFDIKPYLAYTDSHPQAKSGFALTETAGRLEVRFPSELLRLIPEEKRSGLTDILSQDPRPRYQHSSDRVYTMAFAHFDISFRIDGGELFVLDVRPTGGNAK